MDTGELDGLKQGECLLIHRLRLEMTQSDFGGLMGMNRNRYGRIERDQDDYNSDICEEDILPLAAHEKCLLYRRRLGLTQQECADELGVTRYWFNQMEIGKEPVDTLVDYWEK